MPTVWTDFNFFQLIPVLIANIGALSSGLALGYSAILLPQIKEVTVPESLFRPKAILYMIKLQVFLVTLYLKAV